MKMDDISLVPGMRNTFLSLEKTSARTSTVQTRLATGKKVNSALDNPTAFFAASAARSRAADLAARKDGIGEAIQAIASANAGITAIGSLIRSAKGIVDAAFADTEQVKRDVYAKAFNTVMDQVDAVGKDSTYRGTDLLTGGSLTVDLSENSGQSTASVQGAALDAASLGIKKILIPPITPFSGAPAGAQPDWTTIQSQVTFSFNNGDGSSLGNIVAGSIQLFDASNNQSIQPYAQLEDPDSGSVNFYFTSPVQNDSFYATWSAALNENRFDAGGVTTPIQQVLVNGAPVSSQKYSTSATAGGTTIAFTQGNEPSPGQNVQYISEYQTTTPGTVQNVMVNGSEVAKNTYQTTPSGIIFNNGKQPAPGQSVQYVGGYQVSTPGVLQDVLVNGSVVSPANYTTGVSTYNGVTANAIFFNAGHTPQPGQSVSYTVSGNPAQNATVKMVYGTAPLVNALGTGSYPRQETSGVATQLQRLSVWTNTLLKQSMSQLQGAGATLSAASETLHNDDAILSIRSTFIDTMTQTLTDGADNLTLADMNEEGANLLMLQTQQSLATQSLGMAGQAAQGVLKMLGA